MKKILFFFLSLLSVHSVHADWVYLEEQKGAQSNGVTFTDFISEEYEDYIFIFDMLEPLGGFSDTVIQVSTDGGSTWLDTYEGGSCSVRPRIPKIIATEAKDTGIPITNVTNQGYYFIGEVRLCNVSGTHGKPSVKGFGLQGNEGYGTIFGTFGEATGINAVRFISAQPITHPIINRFDITLYGLKRLLPI